MTTRLAALWAAYIFLVLGLVVAVNEIDGVVKDVRKQNCALGELELLVTDLLVGDEGVNEPDRAQYDKLESVIAKLNDLCD